MRKNRLFLVMFAMFVPMLASAQSVSSQDVKRDGSRVGSVQTQEVKRDGSRANEVRRQQAQDVPGKSEDAPGHNKSQSKNKNKEQGKGKNK